MTANSKVTTELVESRRRSPAHLGAPLRRVRLHASLAAARAAGPVTVVVAPAGAGKTTLLADWASLLREEEQPPVRVAWLTADRDEGDPHLFWLAMIESLRNAGVAVSDRPGRAIRALAPARCVAAVGMLVDEIAAHADPLVCILDRHDQLTDPDVTSGLLAFAAALPLTVHMVIAHDAPDETEALHGPSGGLGGVVGFDIVGATVVAADELSFDPDEAVALVGLRIPTSASTGPIVASVAQRSAVGLVLAAVAAQGRRRVASTGPPPPRGNKPAPPRGVDAVTADALARITDRQYQFLVETSLLETVSAPLADAVRGGRDSARILGQLMHRGLPLEALATDGTWYRYHPVLRGTLLTRLWADPVMARSRFGRAAGWYAAAGEPEPAVRCAVAAGDHERAARILADSLGLLVERRSARSRHVLGDLVDRPAAAREPQVCLMMAAALVEDGRPEAAEAWLDSLDLLDGGLDGAATVAGWHSMRAAAATVRAANWRVGTEPERRIAAGRDAVALQAGAGGRSWIAAQVALGSAQIGLGRMDDGMQTLAAALGHAAEVKVPLVASLPAAGTLASALVARHRSGEARMLVGGTRSAVDRVVAELGVGAGPTVSELVLADAALAADDGEFAAAWEKLDRVASLAPAAGYEDALELARARLCMAQRRQGEHEPSPTLAEARSAVEVWRVGLSLTHIERGVLRALCGPAAQKVIEADLGLRPGGLRGRVKELYAKLGVRTRADAVRRAREVFAW